MNDVIDFKTIDEHGPQTYRASFNVAVDEILRPGEIAGLGEVVIEGRVEQDHLEGEYVTDGTVTFTADLNCSRCAEPYPFANTSAFHVRFRPRPEALPENEEVEITDEGELDVEFYSEPILPIRDLALEQVQLSIPMKPLCEESCLGLCPTCGVNRTRERCSCNEKVVDERWGALRNLREELEKKKNV
jgi:uncharacterized protein